MPPRPSPTADLARMYRERIPTAPKSIGRLGPVSVGGGGLSVNPMPLLRSVVRFVRNQPGTRVSTPINMGGGTVAMGGQGGASQLVFDPAAQAVERAVGDVTAIPGVGKPSPSYTAEQIRQQGVVPGVFGAALDYSMFVPAVGAGVRAGRNAMRSATADAAERLAQSMATREMGIGSANSLPKQPFGFRTDHKKWWDVAKHADYEVNDLGNNFPDVSAYDKYEGIWVTHSPEDAMRYGNDIYEVDLNNAMPIYADGDGGFFYVRPITPLAPNPR